MKKFKFYKFSGWLWSVFALVDIANMFVTKNWSSFSEVLMDFAFASLCFYINSLEEINESLEQTIQRKNKIGF
ncbi:hypothetical protein [Bacillus sp. CDB3]|uniref:hypothetical protein n=1 Tax=Bacillus sp. CDB3 TaxID=360310 RepID=UPI0009D8F80D|nr:hypothetical protein [Bacillus sp. CDB3]OQR54815.1 hypothetical protein CDB3_22460 [Bacillus sp. CDB3]